MKPSLCTHHVLFHNKKILGPYCLYCILLLITHYIPFILQFYWTFILTETLGQKTYLFSSLNIGGFHWDFTAAQGSQQQFSVVFKLSVKSHRTIFRDSYSTLSKAFFSFSYSSAKGRCLPFSSNLVFTKLSFYDLLCSLSLIQSLLK